MSQPAAVADVTHRLILSSAGRIHLVEQGSGPLVLLVHGFPESWYSWRHQLPVLAAAGYRAVAVDVRGYGRSSKPDGVAASEHPRRGEPEDRRPGVPGERHRDHPRPARLADRQRQP